MSGHSEGKPGIHAGRVVFDGRFQKRFHPGKVDDLVEFLGDLAPRHPKDRTIQEDVFAPREFWVKTGSDLQ